MSKVDEYREILRGLEDWDAYLLAESGLPGPRGNLELAQAAADEGDETRFRHWLTFTAELAPTNTPEEFLAFCGAVGLGKLLAEGRHDVLETLRARASDARWRSREAVAMALQRWGDVDMDALIDEMESWSKDNCLEQRAAAAALCEPRLLKKPGQVERVLNILDAITASIESVCDRKSENFIALRQGMGYCWSVAVVANPAAGKPLMEKWIGSA
ncbi:MAG: hypothetical protein K8I30_15150, partial [Anaerolineae bacterium]|nr:hypothetical protein [Anaerolineae bacterium]